MRMKIPSFGDYIASADTSSVEVARPLDGDTTVSGNDTTPSDGDTTPSDGDTTPSDGDTTPSDDSGIQSVLRDLREELSEKDSDIGDLADSLRTFVTYMVEAEEIQAEEESQIQALTDYTTPDIPISGFKDWDYPIKVDYQVHVVGFEDYIQQIQTYDSPDIFEEDYADFASHCRPGDTFRDFYIRYIYDRDDTIVYDSEAGVEEPPPEEPKEDLSPAILEALQGIDARLEFMGADVSTISANALDYHTGMLATQDDIRQLQTMNLVTNMAIGFSIFLFLGYTIAHGFWQRMKAG